MTRILHIVGPFDYTTASRYRSDLARSALPKRRLLVDLERMTRFDTAAVAVLIERRRQMREHGGDLELLRVPWQVKPFLRLLGVQSDLPIARDVPGLDRLPVERARVAELRTTSFLAAVGAVAAILVFAVAFLARSPAPRVDVPPRAVPAGVDPVREEAEPPAAAPASERGDEPAGPVFASPTPLSGPETREPPEGAKR